MPTKILIPNLDNLLRRYVAGESENALAKEAGINRWTMRQRILDAGITPRSQSEAEKAKWSRMTEEQRAMQVEAAHEATRGRKVPFVQLVKTAKSREGNIGHHVSPEEIIIGNWLRDAGYDVIHNLAVGPYNCDIGIGPVTVEVWGGGWHAKAKEIERTKYILDAGYAMLIVHLDKRRFPLSTSVTNYAIALHKITSRDPSGRRQYWMVRGNGECIFMRLNCDDISLKPPFTAGRNPSNGQYIRVPD